MPALASKIQGLLEAGPILPVDHDNEWLAEHLVMGVRNAVRRTIRLAREGFVQDRGIAKLAKAVEHRIEEG